MIDLPGYLVVGPLLELPESGEPEADGADLYHGRRIQDGAPVLIKALHEDAEPHRIARLRYEHALLRDLEAPGVARLLAYERWGETQALVLALPPGRPMRALLRAGTMDLRAALRVGAGLARALGALHERHVLHRDVRPESAFADPDTGRVGADPRPHRGARVRLARGPHAGARGGRGAAARRGGGGDRDRSGHGEGAGGAGAGSRRGGDAWYARSRNRLDAADGGLGA